MSNITVRDPRLENKVLLKAEGLQLELADNYDKADWQRISLTHADFSIPIKSDKRIISLNNSNISLQNQETHIQLKINSKLYNAIDLEIKGDIHKGEEQEQKPHYKLSPTHHLQNIPDTCS